MKEKRTVLWKIFISTLYLSAFTFGGGYVIVSLMKKKFVDEYHWIEENEMLDLVAIAQSAPGAIAVNGAIVVGYKLAGIAGVTAGETQLCIQRNCFPLRNDERSALGCGILELIGYGGHICLGRAEERYAQMMAVGGINRPDKTAVGAAKLQCIIEYIFELDIPAALLQRIWPFPQNFNAGQV